ncbi:MAG: 3-deoxy-manno-octulosonate cytidylyltransferase [Alphaproteobacteria bacterium]
MTNSNIDETIKRYNPIIIIPARMAATRLPGKPLAKIAGKEMILHVINRAKEAKIGKVLVACGEEEIANVVNKEGETAILTDPNLPSGSDRIFAALETFDKEGKHKIIVNVQGDLPTIDPQMIRDSLLPLEDEEVDIATLVAKTTTPEENASPNVVKAVTAFAEGKRVARALYFTRTTAPYGEGDIFHHIGLYAYRRASLAKFISLPQGILEKREKLEQLRALENGMRIDATLVNKAPFGVDTKEDLDRAEIMIKQFLK